MKKPSSFYLQELNSLHDDLIILMNEWPSGSSFNMAKPYAEEIVPLIVGQIERLRGVALPLNEANPILLRNKLEEFCNLMNPTDRNQFVPYVVMLNSLIDDEIIE
jgi:hypothetical protein